MSSVNIAIDGPAGAGKSTVAKGLAKKLGYIYVDTGALYRAIGVYAMRHGVDTKDAEGVGALLGDIRVELKFIDGAQRVFLCDEDVSEAIRTPDASMAASNVSAIPAVRAFLLDLQRDIAKKNNCLMDGRDIGTVVLPDAQIKIFMTADVEERAMRRYKELQEKGINDSYEQVLKEMKERDFQDSNRPIAPLKPAEDSLIFDSTGHTLEQSIDELTALIGERV
ncbi:MAG: (d)CMP kinase [Clostridia bacterium]|nr:(d)CMP kinase [Clostridia bacterium]